MKKEQFLKLGVFRVKNFLVLVLRFKKFKSYFTAEFEAYKFVFLFMNLNALIWSFDLARGLSTFGRNCHKVAASSQGDRLLGDRKMIICLIVYFYFHYHTQEC